MTQSEPPSSPTAALAHDEPHGPDHVHVYETAGISEGNRRVPAWLVVVFLSLLAFYVGYIVLQWNAQPGTAKFR